MVNLAICVIVKNEAEYIREWLEFHKLVGVERFYLYDNDSTDNLQEVLQTYIKSGEVIYHHISLRPGQLPAYVHYLEAYRAESVWTAFIDVDEFLFGTVEDDLNKILDKYLQYDGLAANWLVFGSSGNQEKVNGLLIENYTRRSENDYGANQHIKSIIKTSCCIFVINPHTFITTNKSCVDENYNLMQYKYETTKNSVDIIRINHYVCKSVAESKAKWKMGRADTNTKRDWSFFEERLKQNYVEDLCISRFVKPLRNKLNIRPRYLDSVFKALRETTNKARFHT